MRVRHGDRGVEHVQPLLEVLAAERVAERPVEIRVEGADDRAVRLLDREQREDRRERRVDVDDVVPALAQHAAHVLAHGAQPDGDARLRAVGVDRLAAPEPNDVRLLLRRPGMCDVMMSTWCPRVALRARRNARARRRRRGADSSTR